MQRMKQNTHNMAGGSGAYGVEECVGRFLTCRWAWKKKLDVSLLSDSAVSMSPTAMLTPSSGDARGMGICASTKPPVGAAQSGLGTEH